MRRFILATILTLVTVFSLTANERLDKLAADFAEQENGSVKVLISKEIKTFDNDTKAYGILQLTENDDTDYVLVTIHGQNINIYDCHESLEVAVDLYEGNFSKYRVNQYDTDIHDGTIYKCCAVWYKD